MPLDELPVGERMCENCASHISAREVCQPLCVWCEQDDVHPYVGKIGHQWCESRTSRLARAEMRIVELEALLMDALHQGAYVKDGEIDTGALSTWEDIAYYFEDRGVLVKTGGRTFRHPEVPEKKGGE